jgi:hypothetical protein
MQTFEFSRDAMEDAMRKFYAIPGTGRPSSGGAWYAAIFSGHPSNLSRSVLRVYKGTLPVTRPATSAVHAADALVTWTATSEFSASVGACSYSWDTVNHKHHLNFNTIYSVATGTGVATWFSMSLENSTGQIYHWITGSVGTNGSGEDLVLDDVNVTTGGNYKVSNLIICQSPVFTYT